MKSKNNVSTTEDQWEPWMGPMLLLLLTFLMFGDVLFNRGTVLSHLETDLSTMFATWREFGFRQLRSGNLPLWNPYIFAGMPYLGDFVSAMLYPPNLLHLILPLAVAINALIALHIFLSGLFMYFWALRRGLHPLAATMSGALLMFCGAQFLHIYSGHLSSLPCMAWAPLLFLAIDGLFETQQLKWCLLGMMAMAMQILAGSPQYVFYSSVAAGIYWCFRIVKIRGRLAVTAGFAAIFLGGASLSAVQLLTGISASSQSVRGQGVAYEFAAMLSFPPENLMTLVVPNFFGDMITFPYWGRCYLWEMSLFIGVAGLTLAVYGSMKGDKNLRLFSLPMVLILLLLALGAHTPLFKFLYNYFPGFDKFRGNSKFIFQVSLFLAMLAGVGLNTLLQPNGKRLRLTLYVAGGALTALIAGLVLISGTGSNPAQWWRGVMNAVLDTGESYLPEQFYSTTEFVNHAAVTASRGILVAAGTLALLAGLVFASRHWRWAVYGIAMLAIVELFVFARSSRVTFDLVTAKMPQLQQFLSQHPGDYRVLNLMNPNIAMLTGKGDIWGYYAAAVSLRYAQFMAFTQNENLEHATGYQYFRQTSRLFRMLRLRYIFVPGGQGMRGFEPKDDPGRLYLMHGQSLQVLEVKDGLERLHLIYDYEVLTDRDRIFAAMDSPNFEPGKKVILESQPQPAPQKPTTGNEGKVRIIDSSTDHLSIQADLTTPAILLITDGYNKDWRASGLRGSAQTRYQVIQANYVLMAVPLSAGHHYFRMEYTPRLFEVGKWISLASLTAFLVGAGLLLWLRKRSRHREIMAGKSLRS